VFQVADNKFEYCVQSENFTDSAGKLVEFNNSRMIPFRRILIFSINKFFLVTKLLNITVSKSLINDQLVYLHESWLIHLL